MQKLIMDRNTNNLVGSFYNVGPKIHNREKSGLVNTFKMRDFEKETLKDTSKDSPARRPLKYTNSQRECRLSDEKAVMFGITSQKNYRREESDLKTGNLTQRPTSRQKSTMIIERGESPNISIHNSNLMCQRNINNSPEKIKQKDRNFGESHPNPSDLKSKKLYKPNEIENMQERLAQTPSLYHTRISPSKIEYSMKPFDFIPLDGSKGYKSAYRGFEIESQSQPLERSESGNQKKLQRRGLSIDQSIQQGTVEKALTSRRDKRGKYSRDEPYSIAPHSNEKKSTMSRQDFHQLQQQLLQHQQEQLHLQQQQYQAQQQQQQQIMIVNNEVDQIKYFEKLLHIDRMTFDFEKQMILNRHKKSNPQAMPMTTTAATKQTLHSRTRSMEDHASLFQTKSSSRWNTKRSIAGDGQNVEDDTVELAASDLHRAG